MRDGIDFWDWVDHGRSWSAWLDKLLRRLRPNKGRVATPTRSAPTGDTRAGQAQRSTLFSSIAA